jgi:hypothetical protein
MLVVLNLVFIYPSKLSPLAKLNIEGIEDYSSSSLDSSASEIMLS